MQGALIHLALLYLTFAVALMTRLSWYYEHFVTSSFIVFGYILVLVGVFWKREVERKKIVSDEK